MSKKVFLVSLVVIAIIGAALLVPTGKRPFNADIFGERKILGEAKIPPSPRLRRTSETQIKDVLSKAKTFFDNTSEKARQTANKSVEATKIFVTSKAIEAAKSVSETAADKIKEVALNVLQGVEENIRGGNIPLTNTVQVIPPEGTTPPPISYLTKLGSTTSFSIRKSSLPEFNTFTLSVDWGDGVKEERRDLSNSETQVFSHTWNTLGTFDFQFKVSGTTSSKTYTGSITVTK